jgi:hypothetical protein
MTRKQFLLALIAILVALVVGAALNNILHLPTAHAQDQCVVPKAWGTYKGQGSNSRGGPAFIFEDAAGTIRVGASRCDVVTRL